MLLGDPYKFAIIMETIKEGDMVDDTWHNGVLIFCVDGAIFPKRIPTAPLGCEIASFVMFLLLVMVIRSEFWQQSANTKKMR